jgi:SAM-dependent methyltransferase
MPMPTTTEQPRVDGPKTGRIGGFSAHRRRADEELQRLRLRAPSRMANASRNAQAGIDRRRRWAPVRDALWDLLAPWLDEGARVAVVGAGNGDDLPLRRIASRAGEVVLIDIDPRAAQAARRRLGWAERRKATVVGHDVTAGAADQIALAALQGDEPRSRTEGPLARGTLLHRPVPGAIPNPPEDPLPGAPYDLVIGDLLYSQLLYPALLDLGVDADRRAAVLARHGRYLTRALVARLHGSAPRVLHLHDPLAWWDGHEQPVSLDEILTIATTTGPDAALSLAAGGVGPHESDPRAALADLGLSPDEIALWRWPFAAGIDYLTCATLICT